MPGAAPRRALRRSACPRRSGAPTRRSSTGMCGFISPTSCAFATTSAGCVCCSSYSAALGRISFSANSRASARNSFCSSEQRERNAADAGLQCRHRAFLNDCRDGRLTSQSRSYPATVLPRNRPARGLRSLDDDTGFRSHGRLALALGCANGQTPPDHRRRLVAGPCGRALGAARAERRGQDDAPDARRRRRVPERGDGRGAGRASRPHRRLPVARADRLRRREARRAASPLP